MDKKTEMTIEEAFTCPKCGGLKVNLNDIKQLFEDARYEDCTCMDCGSQWRVYYKMKEMNKIVTMLAPDIEEQNKPADGVIPNGVTMEEIPCISAEDAVEAIPGEVEVTPVVEEATDAAE